jgi:hypothetical protein
MPFQALKNQPRKLVAMATMCLVVAIMWPYLFHPTTQFAWNSSLGARGILLGISIAVNFSAALKNRKRRCGGGDV